MPEYGQTGIAANGNYRTGLYVPCYISSMQVTMKIPDEMAQRLTPRGQDLARATLEALAIKGYRSGALTAYQTRRLLGFETRYELDGFLKEHNVWEYAYSLEDLVEDRQTLQKLEAEGRL
jgi:predicted HTH domain antitoxin